MERTIDPASRQMLYVAAERNTSTVWDRMAAQVPQCGFGLLGICCRNCMQGPCRIDPFGNGGPNTGGCGATADTIVARNLDRMIAAGAAAYLDHAKHLARTLMKSATGRAPDYPVRDEGKLRAVAARLVIQVDGKGVDELAREVAGITLAEFSERALPSAFAATTMTLGRVNTFQEHGVFPTSLDGAVIETLHRTTYGVDADPVYLLLGGIKCAVAGYAAMHIASDLADILFGTPKPVFAQANLGTLKADAVNVALYGHNPMLSDIIARIANEFDNEARAAGAQAGVNVVGIGGTGEDILVRQGRSSATSHVSQELPVLTGVVDALVLGSQCIMPSLPAIAQGYHTQVITSMPIGKIPGATYVELTEDNGRVSAQRMIRLAIEAYKKRDPSRVSVPSYTSQTVAGFSLEAMAAAPTGVASQDPLKQLLDNLLNGNIQGICLLTGCGNVKVTQDSHYLEITKRLARANVLLFTAGCAAGSLARHGLLTLDATEEYAGQGLRAALTDIGQAAGLGSLPLVLHLGSCVDNTRALDLAAALANKLGLDLDGLPLVTSIPEATTEKMIAIATWMVAAGLPTHVGVIPPVQGGPSVIRMLTHTTKDLFGGYFIIESDPVAASEKLLAAIQARRKGMGI